MSWKSLLSRIVKVLQNRRWAQPRSQWIVFDAGESPGEETKILVVALLPASLGVMQAPSPLWAQFPCLQTGSGSGLDHLAWKEPPISGIVSISGPRAQLASASQVWRLNAAPRDPASGGKSPCT